MKRKPYVKYRIEANDSCRLKVDKFPLSSKSDEVSLIPKKHKTYLVTRSMEKWKKVVRQEIFQRPQQYR